MASSEGSNPVNENANWRILVWNEQRAAKRFESEWGYLTNRETPAHLSEPHARATVKYFSGPTLYSIATKKVPLQGRDAERAKQQEQEYLATASVSDGRPTTALQATLHTHKGRLGYIDQHNMAFETTSRTYGSRHTLEQFGVSEHGLRATRSKLPSN